MEPFIPHDVLSRVIYGATLVRAWREHLGLSQPEVAARLGIPSSDYARQEASDSLWRPASTSFAAALGISPEQLEV